jgi:hypothetical protein
MALTPKVKTKLKDVPIVATFEDVPTVAKKKKRKTKSK